MGIIQFLPWYMLMVVFTEDSGLGWGSAMSGPKGELKRYSSFQMVRVDTIEYYGKQLRKTPRISLRPMPAKTCSSTLVYPHAHKHGFTLHKQNTLLYH